MGAALVHLHREQVLARPGELVDELVERVRVALERERRGAERLQYRADVGGGEGERRLQHRPPQLEPVPVHALEALHVHRGVAHLDGGVALRREEVQLVALLHALGRERGEAVVGGVEGLAEGAPLPAGDDRGYPGSCASAPAKYSSAVRVFVCCSPERSTPRAARNARASAATWNASPGAHRVESSRMRDPSG